MGLEARGSTGAAVGGGTTETETCSGIRAAERGGAVTAFVGRASSSANRALTLLPPPERREAMEAVLNTSSSSSSFKNDFSVCSRVIALA